MIMEFSLKQISWLLIGSLGIGGTGYLQMDSKIDNLNIQVQVLNTTVQQLTKQLDRIENKLNTKDR
jgi:outer membrane murein-binding lipoprotein Lpp